MVQRKPFFQIQSINVVYPNKENMIIVPITKRMEIILSIPVCLISRMNFGYTKNGGKKAFPTNPKHQHCVSHYGEHDCNANSKKNRDYYGFPSFLIP